MRHNSNRKKIKIDFFIARIARFPRLTSGIMRKLMRHENIVHAVLYIFPEVLPRRICLTIKSFFSRWLFPLFSWPWCVIQGWYREEKLDANHSKGLKGLASSICPSTKLSQVLRFSTFHSNMENKSILPEDKIS